LALQVSDREAARSRAARVRFQRTEAAEPLRGLAQPGLRAARRRVFTWRG